MGKLLERYAQAVNSDSLVVDPRTTWSDTDVLGATGLAAKYDPLGPALVRLFAGGKSKAVIVELTELAFRRARTLRIKVNQAQAEDLSRAVLGWHQHGSCQPCGGTGFERIKDTPALGDECPHCTGGGRIPFDPQFPGDLLALAQWLSGEIERSQAAAGSAAMAMLAPTLELR